MNTKNLGAIHVNCPPRVTPAVLATRELCVRCDTGVPECMRLALHATCKYKQTEYMRYALVDARWAQQCTQLTL